MQQGLVAGRTATIPDRVRPGVRGLTSHARPAGVRAAQVRCQVGEAPAAPDDLLLLGEQTGSPYVATHRAQDAGKVAYCRLRPLAITWANQSHGVSSQAPEAMLCHIIDVPMHIIQDPLHGPNRWLRHPVARFIPGHGKQD